MIYSDNMSPSDNQVPVVGRDELQPYKIHISSKYINLTRQKLELTRLPREQPETILEDWWQPKKTIEPLIDYWLEEYSWNDQVTKLHDSVSQYRAPVYIPSLGLATRIHFIHAKSNRENAVPLLLLPPFPFTNLSLSHLVDMFINPGDPETETPFHLVIPSLPGTGFSDGLPAGMNMIANTAEVLDSLMGQLGYKQYIVSNAGPAINTPFELDWKITNYLAKHFQSSCRGASFISPPLEEPKLQEAPGEWIKWQLAKIYGGGIFGYTKEDLSGNKTRQNTNAALIDKHSFYDPVTLAYALCDSPAGLLTFILSLLKTHGCEEIFSPAQIITMTMLAWLPGPESTLRFWAECAASSKDDMISTGQKPIISLTTLTDATTDTCVYKSSQYEQLSKTTRVGYMCPPAWAKSSYQVISSSRVTGQSSFVAWEQPSLIAIGASVVAKAVFPSSHCMNGSLNSEMAMLEQVVVER